MFELKPLSREAIPAALERATRYRLLNEPGEAESICLDVLQADPDNQEALIVLVLAMTDRFGKGYAICDTEIQEVLGRIRGDYQRAYYTGIACERRAKARLANSTPDASHAAYDYLREAMIWFEKAEALRPTGNDDARLRWNACARIIMRNQLRPRPPEPFEPALE